MAGVTDLGRESEAGRGRGGDLAGAASDATSVPRPESHAQTHAREPARASRAARVWEWFWRRRAMARLRRESLPAWRATEQLRQLARVTAHLAQQAQDPLLESGKSDAVASELYRQSSYWALRALSTMAVPAVGAAAPLPPSELDTPGRDALDTEIAAVWQRVDGDLLRRAAGDPEALALLESLVVTGSFASLAAVGPDEQARRTPILRQFALRLIDACEAPRSALDRLWYERALRLAMLLGIGLVLVVVWLSISSYRERSNDLAAGKPWRASSEGYAGCRSPQQSCPQVAGFFFHTNEEDKPWLEIDLGASQTFSAVRVKNRTDCCRERATPLVVEVSENRQDWKTVATRPNTFTSWKAEFEPTQARWVRLRAQRRTLLHFSEVRVLP
jgi:hypothetical protein